MKIYLIGALLLLNACAPKGSETPPASAPKADQRKAIRAHLRKLASDLDQAEAQIMSYREAER